MLTLINTNKMLPAIGPIGLDYIAASIKRAGIDVEILDLAFADESAKAIKEHFSSGQTDLVGLSFRNAEDCFWPSADWFVPGFRDIVKTVRYMTDAPIVAGGVGFSILAKSIFEYTNVDFGICGDGETALISLAQQLQGKRNFKDVPGLIWRDKNVIRSNAPSWPNPISLGTSRSFINNHRYFKEGGQCGLETKRGCNRNCIYCADPLAKGNILRLRNPSEVADEAQSLLSQGIDVLHLCDSEFNIPRNHAWAVCEEFIKRSLGERIRWYAYLSPVPFDAELAKVMARAGCAGINFTGDAGCKSMLQTYRQQHSRENLAEAVKLCRLNNISVMIDLLLGGPNETPQTVHETIDFIKKINPDCAGAALGVRVYPGTSMEKIVTEELQNGDESNIRRKYNGPVNLFKPTFYISKALGAEPAKLIRDLIDKDKRFFEPAGENDKDESKAGDATDYNYNQNQILTQAIQKGARGAYWDILRKLRDN
jgi:radical SAM superfamily enzyme YgiQ (UPF0313 family)